MHSRCALFPFAATPTRADEVFLCRCTLPQVVTACAQILFQRFFYRKSFVALSVQDYSSACLFLAGKVEEEEQAIRHLINVTHHVARCFKRWVPQVVGVRIRISRGGT